jgi:CHAD domain-containing protein
VAEVTENAAFTNGALSRTLRIPAIEEPLELLSGRLEERREWLKASVKVGFGPYESGRHALQLILASLLRTVAANARAIREGDEEPERLHQLRVAMRKMRVLLGEFGGLFEAEWVAEHRERLRELMRSTNDLRDAQVHRQELERYRKMLPRKERKMIDRLAEHLDREIARQREALVELLDSKVFRKEMEVLEYFASTEGAEGFAPVADGPVILAAKERLKRRFKKLRREGKRLGKKSPPEAYHELRIGVKKLRYLFEFCTSILREEEQQELLRHLKGLQTLLGEHQDRMVQSEALERLARSEEIGDKASREALKELAKRLEKEAAEYREAFPERFAPVAGSRKLLRRAICGF